MPADAPMVLKMGNGLLEEASAPNSRDGAPPVSAPASSDLFEPALIATRAEFDRLESEWNALFERHGQDTQLFQTFNWLWHWCNHFLIGEQNLSLSIVTVRRQGELVLIWPLVKERAGPITKLAWMGEPVSQYGDVILDDAAGGIEALRRAWTFLASTTDASLVQLRKVRADAKVAPLLRELKLMEMEPLAAPYLDLSRAPSIEDYEKEFFSSTARKNRRRQRRRLEDRGPLVAEICRSGPKARDLALSAISLKRDWLKKRGLVSPALSDPRTARFFAEVAEARERPAGCHVMALTSNGRPAALEIGVTAKGRSATHIIVYDDEFEKHSAGAILMEDSIRRAFREGLATFDLLAPSGGYKLDWAEKEMAVSTFVAPLTLAGTIYAYVYLEFARSALKRLLLMLPISIRRHLSA